MFIKMNFSQFFSYIQEAPWYEKFLSPVIKEVTTNDKVLDIGTGSGKLLELLHNKTNSVNTGIDTNNSMLQEAQIKLHKIKVDLVQIEPNKNLPLKNSSFHIISICNVLFNLNEKSVYKILNESIRIIKKGGKIIILSPTGKGGILKLTAKFFSIKNLGIYIWYFATKNRAAEWTNNLILKEYCRKNNLKYNRKFTLNGFAQLETIKV